MQRYLNLFLILSLVLTGVSCSEEDPKTNFVIIFLDDSGWEDFEPFGDKRLATPNVTQLATEGTAFHNFYVPQAVCSASRAALLSGCFPGRTRVFGAHGPNALGLDPQFATMGEVFQQAGYATAVFGKWHIGDRPETRPWSRGFDESCGLMYSNDMWKYHPERPERWGEHPLQYWENDKVKIADMEREDQHNLTKWYTEHAVDFIKRHSDEPFLLYVPHSMPHVPIFCSEEFQGKSGMGLYADVMLEIDWSVGQINQALKDAGVDEHTMIVFTSDNGPWTSYGNHSGSTPYREAKGTSFDGGIRSATIMKYPGQIPAGSISKSTLFTVDLLPTFCHIAEVALPDNEIDGNNVWDLIRGTDGAENPQDYYELTIGRTFEGIMSGDGRWKLHLPHAYRVLQEPGMDGDAGIYGRATIDTALFDMVADPFETTNVLKDEPEVAAAILGIADQHRRTWFPDQVPE